MNEELVNALHEKLGHLEKIRLHLIYLRDEVQQIWDCNTPFDALSYQTLGALVAFKARFAELQDHLAAAMRLIANIEEEDTRKFSYVLNYMEQLEILDSMQTWQTMRDLRNAATHDYAESDAVKSQHFEQLLHSVPSLLAVLDRIQLSVLNRYSESRKS